MTEKVSLLTRFWNYLKRSAMVLGFFVLGSYLILGLFFLFAVMGGRPGSSGSSLKPQPSENYLLHLKLNGDLVDVVPSRSLGFTQLFKPQDNFYLRNLQGLLDKAGPQEQVKGLFLDLTGFSGSLTELNELRKSLKIFKDEHKKPIWVWAPSYNTANYFLGSVADKVFLPKMGMVEIVGSAFQMVFVSGTLEKLGVEFEVFKAGKYKSAMEPLILDEPSPAALEEYQSMQQSILDYFAALISDSRQVSPDVVGQWMKRSLYADQVALDKGLIDGVGFASSLVEDFKKQLGVQEVYSFGEAARFKYSIDKTLVGAKDGKGIALIDAFGQIRSEE